MNNTHYDLCVCVCVYVCVVCKICMHINVPYPWHKPIMFLDSKLGSYLLSNSQSNADAGEWK